ncbi:MAG: hypothetical protein K0Q47_1455, partial [Sedimentibacter sp.]|nr:hypothetical protein [Sedimentibacter sp.]
IITFAVRHCGEMSEWFKEHAWKACLRETVTGVRIPLSPPYFVCFEHTYSNNKIEDLYTPSIRRVYFYKLIMIEVLNVRL